MEDRVAYSIDVSEAESAMEGGDAMERSEKQAGNAIQRRPTNQVRSLSKQETVELIRRTMFAGVPDDEFNLMITLCKHYGLDPLLGHVVLIKNKKTGKYTMYVTRDGLLHIANMSGIPYGIEVGPPIVTTNPYTNRKDIYREGILKRRGHPDLKMGTYFNEHVQVGRDGKPIGAWKTHPNMMHMKVVVCALLRHGFGVSLPVYEENPNVIHEGEVIAGDVTFASEDELAAIASGEMGAEVSVLPHDKRPARKGAEGVVYKVPDDDPLYPGEQVDVVARRYLGFNYLVYLAMRNRIPRKVFSPSFIREALLYVGELAGYDLKTAKVCKNVSKKLLGIPFTLSQIGASHGPTARDVDVVIGYFWLQLRLDPETGEIVIPEGDDRRVSKMTAWYAVHTLLEVRAHGESTVCMWDIWDKLYNEDMRDDKIFAVLLESGTYALQDKEGNILFTEDGPPGEENAESELDDLQALVS